MSVKRFPRFITTKEGNRMMVPDCQTMSVFMGAEYDENAELVVNPVPSLTADQEALASHILSGGKVFVNGVEFEAVDPVDNSAESEPAMQFQAIPIEPDQPTAAFGEVLDAVAQPKRRGRPPNPRPAFPAVGEVRDAEE